MYEHYQGQTKISGFKKDRLWRTNNQEQQVDGENSIWNETSRKWYGSKNATGAMSNSGELAAGKHGVKTKLPALQETCSCTRKRCSEHRKVRNSVHSISTFQCMQSKKHTRPTQSTRCHCAPTLSSFLFCTGVQFSCCYTCLFNDQIKIPAPENRGQCTVHQKHYFPVCS